MEKALNGSHESGSYRSILKSTSIIGGASLINILISMVRTKIVAILLGPSGVGLIGMFAQIVGIIATFTGMGLGNSGVRQVSQAVATGDDRKVGETVIALRRTIWISGILGLLVAVTFCNLISRWTFENERYALSISILGITILLGAVSAGQSCLLQGARRIKEIAKISVVGSLSSTIISIPCYYTWGEKGIIVSLVLSSITGLAITWFYARRIHIVETHVTWVDSFRESRQLVALGVSFMGAGLVTTLSNYMVQMILVREFLLEGAGLYQSAFALSGILVNFVLGAMGTDYYPRLTTVAGDPIKIRQLVNEQTEISLLLALPCLVAMMVFSPLLIQVFYSKNFIAAIPILQWCILGVLGRVISWPMAFVMLALGKGRLYFITETITVIFQVTSLWYLIKIWGLTGAGIAFCLMYVFYIFFMLFVMRTIVGSTWYYKTLKLIILSITVVIIIMINCKYNHQVFSLWAINVMIFSTISMACLKQLSHKSKVTFQTLLSKLIN